MSPARLLEHFDRLIDTPDAVPRFRRFILDLAVRGKLVEQDPKDEPAGGLLKRIRAEKTKLVETGEIRKEKPSPQIVVSEIPFEVPHSWFWSRLADVSVYLQRGKSPKYAAGEGSLVVSQKCVQWDGLHLEWAKMITSESLADYEPIRFLRDGDLLWNSTGTGTIGRVIRLEEPGERLVCDSHVTVVRCLGVDERFIRIWLQSDFVYGTIEGRAAGATNQVELTASIALKQVTPLPPLAEQHRIVAKVDELMALCDELEAAQTKREKRRDRLVAATLHGLNNGDAPSFEESARFYFNHLPRLTTRPEHIHQLRQTILNLAVRGKLVPQDPKDELAAIPTGCLQGRKSRSSDDKPIETGIGARSGAMSGKPFLIPSTWRWVSVADVAEARLGKMLDKAKNKGTPRRYLRNVNVRWFDFDLSDLLEMRFEDSELEEFSLRTGDVLICEGGEPGRAGVWDERESGIYFQKAIHRLRFVGPVMPIFFVRALRHDAISCRLETYFTGVGIKHLTGKGLARYTFPLPPLSEQRRIMAKVDELMALCDELETSLNTATATQGRLLETNLLEALPA